MIVLQSETHKFLTLDEREALAAEVAHIISGKNAIEPFMQNAGDPTRWKLDGNDFWRMIFSSETPHLVGLINKHSKTYPQAERALAMWVGHRFQMTIVDAGLMGR